VPTLPTRPALTARVGVCTAVASLMLVGCGSISMPVLRSRANDQPPPVINAPEDPAHPNAAQCEQLRAQLRANQQEAREAPTISTSPQIVAAAQAKADKRSDDTRARLEELDCPPESDTGVKLRPLAPMPPAPGAASP